MAMKMTLEDMIKQMPKMLRIADDMHRMTNYINDLRIITIVIVCASAIGGVAFVIYKYSQIQSEEDAGSRRRRSYMGDAVDGWELTHVASDGQKGGTPRHPEKMPLPDTPPPPKENHRP